MKKSRFTEEQMVAALREADRATVSEVAKEHRVSEQMLYGWKRSEQVSDSGGRKKKGLHRCNPFF